MYSADKFFNFLKSEVIPYVEKKYPANGERTLYGHSYGGLFVTYAFLMEPQLFNALAPKDLRWKLSLYPNETHNSVRLKGVYDGFKFFYEGYSSARITFHP